MSPRNTFKYCARWDHWPTSRVCCHCTAAKRICGATCAWPSKTYALWTSRWFAATFSGECVSVAYTSFETFVRLRLFSVPMQKQEISPHSAHHRLTSIDFCAAARARLRVRDAADKRCRFVQIDARFLQYWHQRVRDTLRDAWLHSRTASIQLGQFRSHQTVSHSIQENYDGVNIIVVSFGAKNNGGGNTHQSRSNRRSVQRDRTA